MSQLIDLTYAVSPLRSRFVEVHQEVFGLSLARVGSLFRKDDDKQWASREAELDRLLSELSKIREQAIQLPPADLPKRAGIEIRKALLNYTGALAESIHKLRDICQHHRADMPGIHPQARDNETASRADRIAYDDALQYQRHLGSRLNELLSTI
jgi:hypothetical protein